MKGFFIGLLSGAALYWAGNSVLTRDSSPQAKVVAVAAVAPQNSDTVTPAAAHESTVAPADQAVANSPPAGTARNCISVDDENIDRVVHELEIREQKIQQAKLAAEPRDPMWAASTEQQVLAFIAQDSRSRLFVIKTLDCHTLYCEIAAEGPVPTRLDDSDDPRAALSGVLDEVEKQLGLRRGAYGSGQNLGTVEINARLRRFKPGDQCPPGFQRDCWNR
jgi:hypothetical protein